MNRLRLTALSLVTSTLLIALCVSTVEAANKTQSNQAAHHIPPTTHKPTRKRTNPQPAKVSEHLYPINGIFLTDLRDKTSLGYPTPDPELKRKYPGVDLLLTVVAKGKVILSPRALRLKLLPPTNMPHGAFIDMLGLSPDGMHLAAILFSGPAIYGSYSNKDICIINPANGQMRRLTNNAFFNTFDRNVLWQWSPDYRTIAVVEVIDRPTAPHDIHHTRLIVLDTKTGASQVLSERVAEKDGTFERVFWGTSKTGEHGIVFQVKDAAGALPISTPESQKEKHRTYAWFFVPVPNRGDALSDSTRQLEEVDLPSYGVSIFPSAVIKDRKQLRYELSSTSPHNNFAVFRRNDGGMKSLWFDGEMTDDLKAPEPELKWVYVDAGRWQIVDSSGEVIIDCDEAKLPPPFAWTEDEVLLIRYHDGILALNPRTPGAMMRWATIPPQVPKDWGQWIQLSPAQARRAAAQWRHLPNH